MTLPGPCVPGAAAAANPGWPPGPGRLLSVQDESPAGWLSAGTSPRFMITEDSAPRGVASQIRMYDQANEAPRRLIIEWAAQL